MRDKSSQFNATSASGKDTIGLHALHSAFVALSLPSPDKEKKAVDITPSDAHGSHGALVTRNTW